MHVTIYTDGSCYPNPGPGGWAAVLISGPHRKEICGSEAQTTNNRMELRAAIEALKSLKKQDLQVTIYTDSQYLERAFGLDWLKDWQSSNWKNGRLKNADLWAELWELHLRQNVTFKWLRGHDGDAENERCDELATAARLNINRSVNHE
jgi:ribonuclease HI